MLIVGYMLFRQAMWGPRSYEEVKWRRWGPLMVFSLAYPMIIADPLRHVLGDTGLWPGCGNNPHYPRINSSDPYPANCATSSYEYHCTIPCCVPVWLPDGSTTSGGVDEYKWFPNQTSFFPSPMATLPPGQFATLTASGQLFEPPTFDPSVEPYQVYDGSKPIIFYETGELNLQRGPESPATCAPYGFNNLTGYCLMTSDDGKLSLLGPDGSCDCMGCVEHETMSMLSPMGVLITAFFTYFGFFLLSVAVLWNADIVSKLKGVREKWKQLRALQKSQAAAAASLHSPLTAAA